MPRIRPYQQQVAPGGAIAVRRASGSDFGGGAELVQAGNAIAGLGAQLEDTQQRQDVSEVQARIARARAQWTVELEKRAAEAPLGDTSFAETFNRDFNDALSTMGDDIGTRGGREAYKRAVSQLGAEFVQRAGLAQMRRSGEKAKQDYLSALNDNRTTLNSDPTQLDAVLRESLTALDDPNGMYARMPAAARAALREQTEAELTLSAVQGLIRMDPDLAKRKLESGDYDKFLDADKKDALRTTADVAIRAREAEVDRLRAAQERALKQEQEAAATRVFTAIATDPTKVTVHDILNTSMTATQKEHYVDVLRKALKPEKLETDHGLVVELVRRINLPDGDPQKIVNEDVVESYFGNGIGSLELLNQLRAEVQGRRTSEGRIEGDLKKAVMKAAASAITGTEPLLGLRDPKGDELYSGWLSQFLTEWQAQRAAGIPAAHLANPRHKDYIGHSISQFARSPAQRMQDMIDAGNAFSGRAPAGVDPGIAQRAARQGTAADGRRVYEVDGAWVYGDGTPYRP